MRLFASLHNGHSSFTNELLGQGSGPAPFKIRMVEGQWTVVRSRLAALSPGDVVTSVDGKPATEWLAPVRAMIGQSNVMALNRRSWNATYLLPSHFTLGLRGGREVPIDLTIPATGPERGPLPASRVETVERSDGLVVIRIPSFGDPSFEEAAVAAVRAVNPHRPVLIDLRGNGGGNTPVRLLAAIMTRPYRGTLYATPMTIGARDASNSLIGNVPALPTLMMRYGAETVQPAKDAWAGSMTLLVDGGCGSACENFTLRFKDGARGLVMGETTAGTTGQPYTLRFPEFGMSFRVLSKREYFPDGGQFEGIGVRPDRTIPLTIDELRRGSDRQLEAAAKLAHTG
jgi:carboxyl-terminal processing protease